MSDPFQHFLDAQQPVYADVLAELRAGHKQTHWMWFIFPQLAGLGHSAMAQRYALAGADAARAFLAHPVLGARLRECAGLVNAVNRKSVHDIFGSPDDLKFRSSMTLFATAAPPEPAFRAALDTYFGGQGDPLTLARLAA